jgi:hypothetical protein
MSRSWGYKASHWILRLYCSNWDSRYYRTTKVQNRYDCPDWSRKLYVKKVRINNTPSWAKIKHHRSALQYPPNFYNPELPQPPEYAHTTKRSLIKNGKLIRWGDSEPSYVRPRQHGIPEHGKPQQGKPTITVIKLWQESVMEFHVCGIHTIPVHTVEFHAMNFHSMEFP